MSDTTPDRTTLVRDIYRGLFELLTDAPLLTQHEQDRFVELIYAQPLDDHDVPEAIDDAWLTESRLRGSVPQVDLGIATRDVDPTALPARADRAFARMVDEIPPATPAPIAEVTELGPVRPSRYEVRVAALQAAATYRSGTSSRIRIENQDVIKSAKAFETYLEDAVDADADDAEELAE